METIFTKIERGDIPSVRLYEDEICFVILDINPFLKGHALVISRKCYSNMASCPDEVLQHMIVVAKKCDIKMRSVLNCDGTNILINNDPASGQEIPHLHIHVIPRYNSDGRKFFGEHEKYSDGEIQEMGKKLSF